MARRLRPGGRFLSQAVARLAREAEVEDPLIETSAELRVLSAEVPPTGRPQSQL